MSVLGLIAAVAVLVVVMRALGALSRRARRERIIVLTEFEVRQNSRPLASHVEPAPQQPPVNHHDPAA